MTEEEFKALKIGDIIQWNEPSGEFLEMVVGEYNEYYKSVEVFCYHPCYHGKKEFTHIDDCEQITLIT